MAKERTLHVVTNDEAAPPASERADADRLTAIADALYALPVEDFTKARDEAAKAAKADAATIRSWRKPTVSAGLMNLLVRERREQVGELLGLGAAMRDAQATLDGDALRELTRQRTHVVRALAVEAQQIAAAAGRKVGDTVAREVEMSLQAALSDESAAAAVLTGRLVRAISADGFGNADLTDAVTLPDGAGQSIDVRAPERSAPSHGGAAKEDADTEDAKDEEKRKRERAALEKAAREARAEAIRAEEELAATELAVADAEARFDAAQKRVAELEDALDEARTELRESTADERSARQLRDAARKVAAQAQHRAKFAEAAVHD
ncbi:MAG TPA: hypothetical protein VHE83_14360 [Mycobacteriales bacterium]|nr:hypothetical protein [Mycobacteriales bacterium]